jgi:hypothetical protein
MYVLYYASMLRCWHLVWILVRTDHLCLGVGRHNPGYKYLIRSPLGTISYSFSSSSSCLGFLSLLLSTFQQWRTREALSESDVPPWREVLRPATPRLLHRRCLDLHHRQDPHRWCLLTALAHQCLSTGSLWEGLSGGSIFIFR